MGVNYQYDRSPAEPGAWYRSLWFLLLVAFVLALLIAWITVARHAHEELASNPPPTIINSALLLTRSG